MRKIPIIPIFVIILFFLLLKTLILFRYAQAVDGDESIVGLMALHHSTGKSIPFYMYGQNYDAGSGLIARIASLFNGIVSISGISLKSAAFSIWIISCILMVLTNVMLRGFHESLLLLALLVSVPPSAGWVTKARGGQVAAAILANMTFLLALQVYKNLKTRIDKTSMNTVFLIIITALASVLSLWLHPLAFPGVIITFVTLLVIFQVLKSYKSAGVFILSSFIFSIPLIISSFQPSYWSWQNLQGLTAGHNTLDFFIRLVPAHFGSSMDWSGLPETNLHFAAKATWSLSFSVVLTACLLRMFLQSNWKRNPLRVLPVAFFISVTVVIFCSSNSENRSPYILLILYPASCLITASWLLSIDRIHTSRIILRMAISVLIVASATMAHIDLLIKPVLVHGAGEQNNPFPPGDIDRILEFCKRKKICHLFSESPMLQWNIMFASKEKIIARWFSKQDRYPTYIDEVDLAYRNGIPCGLLIAVRNDHALKSAIERYYSGRLEDVLFVEDRWAVVVNPPREVLLYFEGVI